MTFRTITAKYPGICNRCNGPISVGQKIRYAGPRRLWHFASECPNGTGYTDDPPTSHLGNYDAPQLPADDPQIGNDDADSWSETGHTARCHYQGEQWVHCAPDCPHAPRTISPSVSPTSIQTDWEF